MQKSRRLINDTIYQHLEYTKLEDKFLQTKVVNRLLFITQNALAYFAFPSINTKRYIHSIGTMHLASHMLKNSLLNSDENLRDDFIKALHKSITNIIKEKNLNISLDNLDFFDDSSLYEFIIPTKSKLHNNVYIIILQALRLVGLLHDVGHFPFSHQVEYALQKMYRKINEKSLPNHKELEFIHFYKQITNHDENEVLHEAVGSYLIDILFKTELPQLVQTLYDKHYLVLLHTLVKNILDEKQDKYFSYEVLHRYIDGTVDADRLDYINRDMLASGYIGGAVDHIRITKQAVLIQDNDQFVLTFFDEGLLDIEHMLEMRFNLYKKIIHNHKISLSDALLENVVWYMSEQYFTEKQEQQLSDSIAMLWKFINFINKEEQLDIISQLDENWIITLFKKEYFAMKHKSKSSLENSKYLVCFEEILFGKHFFKSVWKNLNDLYNVLEFTQVERYKFRESFGNVSAKKILKLQTSLDEFTKRYQTHEQFFTYQIVSFKTGISKEFSFYDGEKLIPIDQISTLRKRLKKSMRNTVPFYLYCNNTKLTTTMKEELKTILFETI